MIEKYERPIFHLPQHLEELCVPTYTTSIKHERKREKLKIFMVAFLRSYYLRWDN